MDAHLAVKFHSQGIHAVRSIGEVVAEVVFINLTIIASAISTFVGLKFAS